MDNGLRNNDPYRKMESAKKGTTPDFVRGAKNEAARSEAAVSLSSAEDSAAENGITQVGDGVSSVLANEETGSRFYTGQGKANSANSSGKPRVKGFLKRKGPLGLILGLIGGCSGLMMGAQSLMPVAIEEMIIEKFNSIGISSTMTSDVWLNTQLNQGVRLENLKTGETENLFAFSAYQVEKFKAQGIEIVEVGGSTTKITVMLYKKGNSYIPVVGSDFMQYSDSIVAGLRAMGYSNVGTPVSAATALADPAFKTPYTTASKSWRGGASGWFDNIMSDITETKLSINRNRWARYVTKSISGISDDFKKAAASVAKSKTSDGGVVAREEVERTVDVENPDGTTSSETYIDIEEIDYINVEQEDGSIERVPANGGDLAGASTLEQVQSVLESKAVKAASAAADYTCAVLDGVMSIYTVVSAYQNLQFLNLISGYLEAVDKVKAGDGDSSPIHEYSTNLTTASDTKDNDGNVVATGKTAMESAAMANLFSNVSINSNDASVQNVNFESIMSNLSSITKNVRLTAEIYEKCGYVKAATATVDLVTTVVSFIPIVGQGIKALQIGIKEVGKIAIKAAATIALYAIIPIAARKVASLLIQDAATDWFGEDLGNALVSGASKYLGGNGTSGGQSPGSLEKVSAYLSAQDTVIAEEAEYQRSIRDPFDITSPYTFLGSLAYAIMPLAYSGGGVQSIIRQSSDLTTSALVAMLPSANAIEQTDMLTSTTKCDLLETVGAVGDAFCNPYIITDTSTIGYSPVAIADIVHRIGGDTEIASNYDSVVYSSKNFDADGKIRSDSDLAKYITYCGQRTSQYGIKDATIAERITKSNSTAAKIIGYIPVINSVEDIVLGISDEVNLKWTNGKACVASSENGDWDSEYKFYQRYAENERLLENINPGYTSTVTAYLQDYYESSPIDTSLEGTLARFSGMTVDEVNDTLALIEYYQFLDNYDPSTRYAFIVPEQAQEVLIFDNENVLGFVNPPIPKIIFADVRNRTTLTI